MPIQSTMRQRDDKDGDSSLSNKLSTKEVRTAIFNWIYEGYKMFVAKGGKIELSERTKALQLELRDDSNSLRRWIRDVGKVKIEKEFSRMDESWKLLKDWHEEYRQYCKDNGDNTPQNAKAMSRIFREKGYLEKRMTDGIWFCIGKIGDDMEQGGPKFANIPDCELPF